MPVALTYLQQYMSSRRPYRECGWQRGLHRWSGNSQSRQQLPPRAWGQPRNHGKLKIPGEKEKRKIHLDCGHNRLWCSDFLPLNFSNCSHSSARWDTGCVGPGFSLSGNLTRWLWTQWRQPSLNSCSACAPPTYLADSGSSVSWSDVPL